MAERLTITTGEQSDGNTDAAVPVTTRTFTSEPEFQRAVEELAKDFNWDVFHVPDRAYEVGIPYSGFPDLILRYRDESGCTMIVAELKYVEEPRNAEEGKRLDLQKQFLRDFANYSIPVFLFYPKDWGYIIQMLKDGPPAATCDIIEPSLPIPQSKELLAPTWDDNRVVRSFLQEISDFHYTGRGELAELRRMSPDKPDAATYWRLMARTNRLGCPATESKWALILHGMALMAPNVDSTTPVGKALFLGGEAQRAQAFYSESRLNRLLTARGPMLRVLLARMFRMLATSRVSFNWREMAQYILNEGYNEETAEQGRRHIARDYYQAERRSSQQSEAQGE